MRNVAGDYWNGDEDPPQQGFVAGIAWQQKR